MDAPKPKNPRQPTAKQRRFVDEYLKDLNATQAAIRSGYKKNSAHDVGRRLIEKSLVSDLIAQKQRELSEKTGVTVANVLREIALVANSDIGDILDFSRAQPCLRPANEIPEAARRAISSVKVRRYVEGRGDDAQEVEIVEFKLWSKTEALRDLAKHTGVLKEKVEHTGADGGPIQHSFDLSSMSDEQIAKLAGLVSGIVGPQGADSPADAE